MSKEDIGELVKQNLVKLATGEINDVIRLAFFDELPTLRELKKLNLFNVSEIKRTKGGAVEIKIFDRQKALEKLYELYENEGTENIALGLLEALGQETENITENSEDD
jgi:hypothetical protein